MDFSISWLLIIFFWLSVKLAVHQGLAGTITFGAQAPNRDAFTVVLPLSNQEVSDMSNLQTLALQFVELLVQ